MRWCDWIYLVEIKRLSFHFEPKSIEEWQTLGEKLEYSVVVDGEHYEKYLVLLFELIFKKSLNYIIIFLNDSREDFSLVHFSLRYAWGCINTWPCGRWLSQTETNSPMFCWIYHRETLLDLNIELKSVKISYFVKVYTHTFWKLARSACLPVTNSTKSRAKRPGGVLLKSSIGLDIFLRKIRKMD